MAFFSYILLERKVADMESWTWTDPHDDEVFFEASQTWADEAKTYMRNVAQYNTRITPCKVKRQEHEKQLKRVLRKYDPKQEHQRLARGGVKFPH